MHGVEFLPKICAQLGRSALMLIYCYYYLICDLLSFSIFTRVYVYVSLSFFLQNSAYNVELDFFV